jgi:lipid-A-disaccharide synthase-like uncharacterized protein
MIARFVVALLAAAAPAPATLWARVLEWANVSAPWELWLVAFGVLAQSLFFCRWIVQWLASEQRGESHVPMAFWWLSLAGASLLLIYFALRGEPVGLLGQSVGWIVYLRNIMLIRRRRASQLLAE